MLKRHTLRVRLNNSKKICREGELLARIPQLNYVREPRRTPSFQGSRSGERRAGVRTPCQRTTQVLTVSGYLRMEPAGRSGKDVPDHVSVDVGESEVAALETVGQSFVVDAQQVQEGGLEVVDMNLVLDGVDAEVV